MLDPTYYTSQGIISGSSQMFGSVEGRSTPTGLESASTVRSSISYYYLLYGYNSTHSLIGCFVVMTEHHYLHL